MNSKKTYKDIFSFNKHEISDFFKHAPRVYRSPDLDLLCKPAVFPYGRFIPLTPKRLGSAPVRNKLRRQLKSIFYEQNLSSYPVDCVMLLKKGILNCSFVQLQEVVLKSIGKAHDHFLKK